jgi:hypothetical protein
MHDKPGLGRKGYRPSVRTQQLHRERTEKKFTADASPQSHGEAEVVIGWQLANVLRAWLDQWRRERPPDQTTGNAKYKQEGGNETVYFMGAMNYLSDKSGLSVRYLSRLVACEMEHVNLSKADAVLQAMERADYLGNEIEVVPNPRWSREKWQRYMHERGCI